MSFTLPVHIVYLDFICVSRDKNSSSNMKIDTLSFLNCILIHHQPTVFLPHVKTLVPVGKPHSDISNGLGFYQHYCGIIFILGVQCSWIIQIFLVCWDIILGFGVCCITF